MRQFFVFVEGLGDLRREQGLSSSSYVHVLSKGQLWLYFLCSGKCRASFTLGVHRVHCKRQLFAKLDEHRKQADEEQHEGLKKEKSEGTVDTVGFLQLCLWQHFYTQSCISTAQVIPKEGKMSCGNAGHERRIHWLGILGAVWAWCGAGDTSSWSYGAAFINTCTKSCVSVKQTYFILRASLSLWVAASFCRINIAQFFLQAIFPLLLVTCCFISLTYLCYLFHMSVGVLKRERLPDLPSHATGNCVDKQYKITLEWKRPIACSEANK